jgi:hypothetical protein
LYIRQSNNFHDKDLQVFCFLIDKGSHFLRFSVISALNHLYWRLRPGRKTVCHIVQKLQENLNKRELAVSRRDIGVKSLSETKTSPLLSKDSKEKQTGEGLLESL